MDGLAVGQACYRDHAEAGLHACAMAFGVTSGGVASCADPSVTDGVLSYTLSIDSGTGVTSRAVTQQLQPCEPQDWTFYQPVVGAWFLALVVILCGRMLYTRTFPRGAT